MDSLPGQKKVTVVERWLLVKGLTVLQTHLRRGSLIEMGGLFERGVYLM